MDGYFRVFSIVLELIKSLVILFLLRGVDILSSSISSCLSFDSSVLIISSHSLHIYQNLQPRFPSHVVEPLLSELIIICI